jgi:hypothetical protein
MIRRVVQTRKRRLAAVGSGVALAAVVAAVAYFTNSGSGTGQATVGTSTPWGVTFQATTGTMLPGSGTSTVNYTVTNNGTGNQRLTTTTASVVSNAGNVTSSGTPVPGCLASWFSAANNPPAPVTLAAGGSTTGSAGITMAESGTNQDACQGVTPDILVSAS